MSLILIVPIFAALWLLLALVSLEVKKRWHTARIGSLIGKEALAAALKTALTLSKIAALTYGALLLLVFLLQLLGRHIAMSDYQAVLDGLESVRGVLSFASGGLGKVCFAIVIVILAWRLYGRYFQAISSEAAKHDDPDSPPPSWLALLGQFLASKAFFKHTKILGKYSSNFATIVFCLSLVGVGGSAVNQALEGAMVPSKSTITLENMTADSSTVPREPASQQTQDEQADSEVIDDERFREIIAQAVVDAFAQSPAWKDGILREIPIDQKGLTRAVVPLTGSSPSVELVEELMAKEPAKIPFGKYDQAARRTLQNGLSRTTRQGTREVGQMVLDGLLTEAFGEILPDPSDPIGGKVLKPFSKAAQSAAGKALSMAFDNVAGKVKDGTSLGQALWDLRTLPLQELPESGLKEIATMFAQAKAEMAPIPVAPVKKVPAAKVGNVAGAAEKKAGASATGGFLKKLGTCLVRLVLRRGC